MVDKAKAKYGDKYESKLKKKYFFICLFQK